MLNKSAALEYILNKGFTSTEDVCEAFHISKSTARRAFAEFEQQGLVDRIYGGVVPASEVVKHPEGDRLEYRRGNLEIKKKIAREAAKIIKDNSFIILLGGTTVAELCDYISHLNLTVVTNSFPVFNKLNDVKNIQLIFLGGIYNRNEDEVDGSLSQISLKNMRADHLFMGTFGFDEHFGFCTAVPALELYESCIKNSINVCVLTDSSKYMKGGVQVTARPEQVDYLFVDKELPESAIQSFANSGTKVIIAD